MSLQNYNETPINITAYIEVYTQTSTVPMRESVENLLKLTQ